MRLAYYWGMTHATEGSMGPDEAIILWFGTMVLLIVLVGGLLGVGT